MKMLWIISRLPYPPISGYHLRVYHLLKRLAEHHEMYLFSFKGEEDETAIQGLKPYCTGIRLVEMPGYHGTAKPGEFFSYLFRGIPPELRLYHSPESVQALTDYIHDISFDLIQFEDSFMAIYLSLIPSLKNIRKVLNFQDIIFEKMDRAYKLEKKFIRKIRLWLYSRTMRTWEPAAAGEFDLCVTMSAEDTALLRAKNPNLNIKIIPNGVDTKENQPLPPAAEGDAIVFTGNMAYLPNVDAADYFVHEILPLIRRRKPDVTLWIVGINPDERVIKLAEARIIVTGRVESVQPYYARARVCVVPLRAGGGTRLKILESMALCRPVVSTSIGSEGLDVEDGKTIFIADDAAAFAASVLLLMDDDARSHEMTTLAREMVVKRYDWDVIAEIALREFAQISS